MNYSNYSPQELKALVKQGDMSALDELEKRANQADLKPLTELLNERGFEKALLDEQQRVSRGQSVGGVILNIDLAGFKRINDQYGEREGGDVALKAFAKHLKSFGFRNLDIIANPGGDEFYIVLTNTKMDIQTYKNDKISGEFKVVADELTDAQKLGRKVERFIRESRAILIEATDINGQNFHEIIRTRITAAEYGDPQKGEPSIQEALKKSAKLAKPLKNMTKQYVQGGR